MTITLTNMANVVVKDNQHTPGPWKAFEDSPYEYPNHYQINAGVGFFDADEQKSKGFCITGFMSEYDSRLVAAAPELLKACQQANRLLNDHFGIDDSDEAGNETHDLLRAAITKATTANS